jgi:uncharacterized membrane protein YhaH (DUF805 family)
MDDLVLRRLARSVLRARHMLRLAPSYAPSTLGRASRAEFWLTLLAAIAAFSILSGVVAALVGEVTDLAALSLGGLMFLPVGSATVRRMHDINLPAIDLFVILIPYWGAGRVLVYMLTAGTAGPNDFGPDTRTEPRR